MRPESPPAADPLAPSAGASPVDAAPGEAAGDDGVATVLARIGGNLAMLRELLGIFETDSARLVAQLHDAARAGDGDRLARAAHTLKGMVGFFEAPAAVGAAMELDALGRSGRFATAPALIETLSRETRRIATRFRPIAAAPTSSAAPAALPPRSSRRAGRP
jgi:two-component system sensor histidine kinase/response regulator